jgi:uncharacterized peroxidase-related enzyme
MRLGILDHGLPIPTKAMFALIGLFTRQPVTDSVKLALYRQDFFGGALLTHEAMRGPSRWSVGDRELMAAFVSKVNDCQFCVQAHSATSRMLYRDDARVGGTLADLETAPIEEPLRATLRMLRNLPREHAVDEDDMRNVLAAGVSREQIREALAVCLAFNTTDRLADTFDFDAAGWGVLSAVRMPSGAELQLYEPRHSVAYVPFVAHWCARERDLRRSSCC